jgi:hypothetical protein
MVSTTTWDAASCFALALDVFLTLGRNAWVVALVVPPSRSTTLDCGLPLLLHESYSSCHLWQSFTVVPQCTMLKDLPSWAALNQTKAWNNKSSTPRPLTHRFLTWSYAAVNLVHCSTMSCHLFVMAFSLRLLSNGCSPNCLCSCK